MFDLSVNCAINRSIISITDYNRLGLVVAALVLGVERLVIGTYSELCWLSRYRPSTHISRHRPTSVCTKRPYVNASTSPAYVPGN